MSGETLFDRRWAVTVGPPDGDGKKWTDLRVTFHVEKSGSATPNKATVEIYNLKEESRKYITKRMAFILGGGYVGNATQLFSGAVELIDHEQHGPDWVTKLENHDGVHAYRGLVLSESFKPGTTETAVVDAIARKMGVKVGDLKGLGIRSKADGKVLRKGQWNHGRTLSGTARAELDALCRRAGARWSIQDGVLQVLRLGQSLDDEAVVVSPATGLVGSPKVTETGVKFTMLLTGKLVPGKLVQLDTRYIKGNYVVENVVHTGDSHGHAWHTHIDAIHLF
jgi:hypothetical protein